MLRAMLRAYATRMTSWQCTDGRTDGLTENLLTIRTILSLRNARARIRDFCIESRPDGAA